jgi:glycosyltransferase 2 family protein
MKRRLVIGILISGIFFYLALRNVDWQTFLQALGRASLVPLGLAIFSAVLAVYLRAWRWRMLVAPMKRVSTWRLFVMLMIGSMANNVLPARLGDLARAYLLGRTESMSKSAALATVVYERILDVFSALALLWVALLVTPSPMWLRRAGIGIFVGNTLALFLLVLMVIFRRRVYLLVHTLTRPFGNKIQSRIGDICDSFISGLEVITSGRSFLPLIVSSTVITVVTILPVYLCFFGMGLPLGFAPAVTLTVLVSFSTMIPAAPGNVGPVQYACIVGLAIFKIESGQALAYSLIYHAAHYLPITLIGFFFLWREQLSMKELAFLQRRDAPEAEDPDRGAIGDDPHHQ